MILKLNLKDFDHQQTQMLQQVKEETEYLENERQKLIEQFKKEKNQLQIIEKKLIKLEQNLMPQQQSLMQKSFNQNNLNDMKSTMVINEIDDDDDDDDYDQVPNNDELLTTNSDTSINLILNNQNYSNNVSTSAKDLFHFNANKIIYKQNNEQSQQQSPLNQNVNKSTGSLNLSTTLLNGNCLLDKTSNLSIISSNNNNNNNQYAFKFAELEHKLALTRAENQVLLEEQVIFYNFFI